MMMMKNDENVKKCISDFAKFDQVFDEIFDEKIDRVFRRSRGMGGRVLFLEGVPERGGGGVWDPGTPGGPTTGTVKRPPVRHVDPQGGQKLRPSP